MSEIDLRKFGYADGNYTIKCIDCEQWRTGDKKCQRCKECATKAYNEYVEPTLQPASEALEALSTIEDFIISLIKDRPLREGWTLVAEIGPEFETIRQALAQRVWQPIETAPKDGTVNGCQRL